MRFLCFLNRKLGPVLLLLMASVTWSSRVDAASLRLAWTDTASDEDGFKIERAAGGTFSVIATVGANVISYIDSSALAGTTYCYRVRAFSSAGTSSPSNQACARAVDTTTTTVSLSGDMTGSTSSTSTGTTDPISSSGGTLASQGGARWSDYRVTMKIKSTDNDFIGVMFRYQDNDNYYRFGWASQYKYRGLLKRKDGVWKVLDWEPVSYVPGQTYQLEITAEGTRLEIRIDGALIFSVTDSSIAEGTIGLYSRYNKGSYFDNVLVEDLSTGDVLLWDNFAGGDFSGWTIVDEGTSYGPSKWSAQSGALVQNSDIGSSSPDYLGTFALYTY